MIRKTMRIGEVRTSIKLEQEFWEYLKEVADDRALRLSALVNEIARATPDRTNLASTLRTFALVHARLRAQTLRQELDKLSLAGNSEDLVRVLDSCPLPCLVLDSDRSVRRLNRSFSQWLNLDIKATIGQRLENILILRGAGLSEMWRAVFEGRTPRGMFNATYVSPGKVRTSQALAVPLAGGSDMSSRSCVVMFETLAGKS